MERFREGTKVSFPVPHGKGGGCNHVFHTRCIETWLMKNSDCPICRRTFLGSKESQLFMRCAHHYFESPHFSYRNQAFTSDYTIIDQSYSVTRNGSSLMRLTDDNYEVAESYGTSSGDEQWLDEESDGEFTC